MENLSAVPSPACRGGNEQDEQSGRASWRRGHRDRGLGTGMTSPLQGADGYLCQNKYRAREVRTIRLQHLGEGPNTV